MALAKTFLTCVVCKVKHDLSFDVNRITISDEGLVQCPTCREVFIHPVIKDILNKQRDLEKRIKELENPNNNLNEVTIK